MRKKIVHYVNQFFGQIGGEEFTHIKPILKNEPVPLSVNLARQMGAEICCTVIAGDNYMAENVVEGRKLIVDLIRDIDFDLFVAGPAFFAGRYGIACGAVCEAVSNELRKPAITAMHEENPGVSVYRSKVLIARCASSAAKMREALYNLSALADSVHSGNKMPECDYFKQGRRLNVFLEKIGAERALDMLMKKVRGESFVTEVPIPVFDKVPPAPAVRDLKGTKLALISTGGVVPFGNPDRMPTGNSQKWATSNIKGLRGFEKGDWETVHAGYDVARIDEDPDRLVPLDVAVDLVEQGVIGSLHDQYIYTVGNTTSVSNAKKFGQEIAAYLKENSVSEAIMTST
jgi:glycine reductase